MTALAACNAWPHKLAGEAASTNYGDKYLNEVKGRPSPAVNLQGEIGEENKFYIELADELSKCFPCTSNLLRPLCGANKTLRRVGLREPIFGRNKRCVYSALQTPFLAGVRWSSEGAYALGNSHEFLDSPLPLQWRRWNVNKSKPVSACLVLP